MPLSKSDAWWIRIFDFPRLQFLVFGLGVGAIFWFASPEGQLIKFGFLSVLFFGAAFDFYRVIPYSPFWRLESLRSMVKDSSRSISLLTVNVLQQNEDPVKLLSLIETKSPDLVLLLEVNERWIKDLAPLKSKYKFKMEQPQENEYGLAFYSQLPLKNVEIRFLVEPEIPSVRAEVELPSGEFIKVIGLHPRPPRPQDGDSTERDAELVMVAKEVRNLTAPVIVMGDFNDVAWSHTTRLFRRISGLIDPRVGRGPFSTFPASSLIFRFPLDYFFHSSSFSLNSIELLGDVGSDHLPIYMSLSLGDVNSGSSSAPRIEDGDMKEANETIERANK